MTDTDHGSSHIPGTVTGASAPLPSLAEMARTLVLQGGASTLATMSQKHLGYPFASVMPYGLTAEGEPTLLVSSMAMHTRNFSANPRATLLIAAQANDGTPLANQRISLVGDIRPLVDRSSIDAVSKAYLNRNPDAKHWIDFGDFDFFHLHIQEAYFVGGFGVMGWVDRSEYLAASPDPLASDADGIIRHMNADHRDALILFAKQQGISAQDAEMTSIDRLGFQLRVTTVNGVKGTRVAYPQAVENASEIRDVIVTMVQVARRKP